MLLLHPLAPLLLSDGSSFLFILFFLSWSAAFSLRKRIVNYNAIKANGTTKKTKQNNNKNKKKQL